MSMMQAPIVMDGNSFYSLKYNLRKELRELVAILEEVEQTQKNLASLDIWRGKARNFYFTKSRDLSDNIDTFFSLADDIIKFTDTVYDNFIIANKNISYRG